MAGKGLFLFALWLALLCSAAAAGEGRKVGLLELEELALESNSTLAAASARHRSLEYRAAAAGVLPDPQLTVGILNLPRSSLSFDETPMSGVSIGLSQTIPWPSKLGARSKIASQDAQAEEFELAVSRDRLIRLVRSAYYEYSYRIFSDVILDSTLVYVRNLIEVATTAYANGDGPVRDVLRAQTLKARLDNKKLAVEQGRQSALLALIRLTEDTTLTGAEIVPALTDVGPLDRGDLIGASLSHSPLLKKAGALREGAAAREDLSRADYWPDLTFGFEYRLRRETTMDPVAGEDFLSAKVGLRLPLWFSRGQKNKARAAEQGYLAQSEMESSVRQQLRQRVEDLSLALRTTAESYQHYGVAIIPPAQAAYDAARVAYEVGGGGFDELLSAQKDLIDIRLERLGLRKQYSQKLAELQEVIGDGEIR